MFINYENILKRNQNWYNKKDSNNRVLAWFSGGVASTVACHLALELYSNVEIAFCDTGMEHEEVYRLMSDFENKFGVVINKYKSDKFNNPEAVWRKYKGLSFANGAPCSSVLKSDVRVKKIQKIDDDYAQIFGFDFDKKEIRRAKNMVKNYAEINPKFLLIENEITRQDLFKYFKRIGLVPPLVYKNFQNNNCLGGENSEMGGCVRGGIGYWKRIRDIYPKKFNYMANVEHEISIIKGRPVAINKDQRKGKDRALLFLKSCKEFPEIKTIDEIKGKPPISPMECDGFCGDIVEQIGLI